MVGVLVADGEDLRLLDLVRRPDRPVQDLDLDVTRLEGTEVDGHDDRPLVVETGGAGGRLDTDHLHPFPGRRHVRRHAARACPRAAPLRERDVRRRRRGP